MHTCLFSSHVGDLPVAGVIFTPVYTEIVSFAPELVGGKCIMKCVKLYTSRNISVNAYNLLCIPLILIFHF